MTPPFLNPTEQSLIAFLLFQHVAGAHPCPQEKCYGKRWGGRREQSGGQARRTHGICVPVLQCLIPRRIPRCSSCQLTELQLSTQTDMPLLWHGGPSSGSHMASHEHHLWIALQSCRKADRIFLSPNSSQKLKHREHKYGQYNLVLKNTTAAEKLVKPMLLSRLSLRCWINILLLTSIHSVY